MASKTDPLSSFYLPGKKAPLRTGGGAMRAGESPAEFLERLLVKKSYKPPIVPVIITAVEGSVELAGLYYGVGADMIEDICKTDKASKDALMKARAVAYARKKDGDAAADVIKRVAEDAVADMPALPVRERWPVDEKERLAAIKKWLVDEDVLLLYEGDLSKISTGGRVPLHVLVSLVKADGELTKLKDAGDYVASARMEGKLRDIAERANNPTAVMKFLQAKGDESWQDRSKVELRRVGFEVPDDDDVAVGSVLRRVK